VAAVHRDDQIDAVRSAARDAGVGVEVETLDVTDDDRARDVIERRQPWGLVNNASLLWPGLLEEQSPDEARRHVEVMLFAPMRLATGAAGHAPAWPGRIVNVSSIHGDAGGPLLGWYEATKGPPVCHEHVTASRVRKSTRSVPSDTMSVTSTQTVAFGRSRRAAVRFR
jgi:NAD(P)-dependent dehydrogenase (short-subunit alcohol dehydrogenase family)